MSVSNRWLAIFLILPHLSVYYFNLEQVQPIMFCWQAAVILIALVLLFRRITVFNLMLMMYMAVILFSAVINRTLTGGILFSTVLLVALCIYIANAIKNPAEFFKGMYYLFSAIILLNFFTVLNNGITIIVEPIYLIGGKNALAMTLLPAISMILIYSYITHKKIRTVPLITILIGIASIFLTGSGTGVIVAILLTLFLFGWKKQLPSLKNYMVIYLIMFFAIVIFRLQDVLFGSFITNTLNKTITFTGRTYIWDFVLSVIGDSWLLGFGRGTNLVNQYFPHVSEAHNGFLEVLLYSGVLGITFFVVILLKVAKNLAVFKKHIISQVLSFSVFAYMVLGLAESVFYKKEFWILLVISYGISNLIKVKEEVSQEGNLTPPLEQTAK